MSTDLELESGSRSFAVVIAPLLKEYAVRLQDAIQSVMQRESDLAQLEDRKAHSERAVAARLLDFERQQIQNLLPGLERLARQTSQQLEHGVLDEPSRIELEARLAEFEALLRSANDATFLGT